MQKLVAVRIQGHGLDTADDSIADVAIKIAELVAVEENLTARLASAD